jgi:hypothetical protein
LKSGCWSGLKLQLTGPGTLVSSLNALVTQKWTANVVNGQTGLWTSEAGGSVTCKFERAYTPAELTVMAEEALEWVTTLANPENPLLDVTRYTRIHPTFHKAVLLSRFFAACSLRLPVFRSEPRQFDLPNLRSTLPRP